ncbi:MAG: hypothetical protein Q8930_18890 [Bacillota bacterium]|nr:hypothetical protein [Bacillota bacterium]
MAVILILLGIVLVIFSSYSIVKESTGNEERGFSKVLKTEEKNVKSIDFTIVEMRREFAETIMELQMDILNLKEKLDLDDSEENVKEKEEEENPIQPDSEEKLTLNGVKINDISRLLNEGYTLDDISEKLEISKGEILLIKDLYLK